MHYIAEKSSTEACRMQNLDKYCSAEQFQYLLRQYRLTKQANHKLEHRSKSDGKKITECENEKVHLKDKVGTA